MPQVITVPFRRIAFGNQDEFRQAGALKAALAEFISTLIFVFAGEGSSMAYSKLTHGGPSSPVGIIIAALAYGLGLFVGVSVSANISGGHVNPAVTIGAILGGNITFFRGLLYIIFQLVGSIVACLLLWFTSGGMETSALNISGESVWNAFVLEIVMTFGLVYTVYATAIDPKKGDVGTIAPIAIGLIVAANILAGGAFDGGCMNPAVAFGPAVVSWSWKHHWVYWVGPIIGAAIAAAIYEIFFMERSHEAVPAADY